MTTSSCSQWHLRFWQKEMKLNRPMQRRAETTRMNDTKVTIHAMHSLISVVYYLLACSLLSAVVCAFANSAGCQIHVKFAFLEILISWGASETKPLKKMKLYRDCILDKPHTLIHFTLSSIMHFALANKTTSRRIFIGMSALNIAKIKP